MTFVFVCQGGEWEVKAMLLAASLRRHHGTNFELIAAVPGPPEVWGELSDHTRALIGSLNLRSVSITNPIDPSFAHANKIACLKVQTEARKLVFLDSDMLCMRPLELSDLGCDLLSAKVADLPTFSRDEEGWSGAYRAAGVGIPTRRVTTTVDGCQTLPFYNTGVIAICPELARSLAEAWADCCRLVREQPELPDRRLWSDQIGFAVALEKLGIIPRHLEDRWNYPAHLQPLPSEDLPYFAHYHFPSVIAREPILRETVRSLCREHPELRNLCESHRKWREIVDPSEAALPPTFLKRVGRRLSRLARTSRTNGGARRQAL